MVHTRAHIAYAVGKYVMETLEYGLVYSKGTSNYILAGFSDSNLAGDTDNRNSTSDMYFYLNDNLITWVSQKQKCVALFSSETEYMTATAAAC